MIKTKKEKEEKKGKNDIKLNFIQNILKNIKICRY